MLSKLIAKSGAALGRLGKDEKGASLIEYALLAALIAIAAVTTMGTVGGKVNTTFTKVDAKLPAN